MVGGSLIGKSIRIRIERFKGILDHSVMSHPLFFSFTIWGQVDTPDAKVYLLMAHFKQDEDKKTLLLTSKLNPSAVQWTGKFGIEKTHIGGTFVERLSKGEKVAIAKTGERGFVYSGDGGGILTFGGELIAVSNFKYSQK